MHSFQELTHSVFDEPTKSHLYGKLNLLKTVADFFLALAGLREKYAMEMEELVSNYKKKAQSERPQYGSTLMNLWEAILHIVDLDAKCHSEFAQTLLKRLSVTLSDFYDTRAEQYDRLFAHRVNVAHLIQNSAQTAQENFRNYCDVHSRYRSGSSKVNRAALLRAHNDYVLQLQASNSMLEEMHYSEIPQIMRDLDETDSSTSMVFSETADAFVSGSINFAVHQKLRYDTIQRDECSRVNMRLDMSNFVKYCETEIGRPDCFGRERWALEFRLPPTMKENELGNDIVNEKQIEAELRERLSELQRHHHELTGSIESTSNALRSLENLVQSYASSVKSQAGPQIRRSSSANRFPTATATYDRKVLELQQDVCRKSCEVRLAGIEVAGLRKQIELLGIATRTPESLLHIDRAKRERTVSNSASASISIGGAVGGSTSPPARLTDDASMTFSSMSSFSQNSNALEKQREKDKDKDKESSSRLLGMSMWKQAVSRFRKSSEQRTQKSKASAANKQIEADEIDPIYSLLRCANTLPRPLAGANAGTPKTQSGQPSGSPTKQSPPAAPAGTTPTASSSSSSYQAPRSQLSSVTRQSSTHSIMNGAASDEPDASRSTRPAVNNNSGQRGKGLTNSGQKTKLANMRSISVDESAHPLITGLIVSGRTHENISMVNDANGSDNRSGQGSTRRISSVGAASRDVRPTTVLLNQREESPNRHSSREREHPSQMANDSGDVINPNLLSAPQASSTSKGDRRSRARNFSRKPSSSFDVPEAGDSKEVYISISSTEHRLMPQTSPRVRPSQPQSGAPAPYKSTLAQEERLRRGSAANLPISNTIGAFRSPNNDRKRSEIGRSPQLDRENQRYDAYQENPGIKHDSNAANELSYQNRRWNEAGNTERERERVYLEGASPRHVARISPSKRTSSRPNLMRSTYLDYTADSENYRW